MRTAILAPLPVELTVPEQELLKGIEFNLSRNRHDAAFARKNGETVLELMRLLIQRDAIPEIRIRVFTDPEFFIGGRGSSHLDVFKRNGTSGDAIFRHPHFLKYLHYFLFGPDLPRPVCQAFCQTVSDCAPVTSGDVETLCIKAKELTRRHYLDKSYAAESFYRLALECELDESTARMIRDDVKRLR